MLIFLIIIAIVFSQYIKETLVSGGSNCVGGTQIVQYYKLNACAPLSSLSIEFTESGGVYNKNTYTQQSCGGTPSSIPITVDGTTCNYGMYLYQNLASIPVLNSNQYGKGSYTDQYCTDFASLMVFDTGGADCSIMQASCAAASVGWGYDIFDCEDFDWENGSGYSESSDDGGESSSDEEESSDESSDGEGEDDDGNNNEGDDDDSNILANHTLTRTIINVLIYILMFILVIVFIALIVYFLLRNIKSGGVKIDDIQLEYEGNLDELDKPKKKIVNLGDDLIVNDPIERKEPQRTSPKRVSPNRRNISPNRPSNRPPSPRRPSPRRPSPNSRRKVSPKRPSNRPPSPRRPSPRRPSPNSRRKVSPRRPSPKSRRKKAKVINI